MSPAEHIQHPNSGPPVHIQIDRIHYTVNQAVLTGAQLRQLPATPIAADLDLFEVVPGGSDRKIADTDVVKLHDGQRFFTVPAKINPGRCQSP